MSDSPARTVVVALLGRAHGVRGQLRAQPIDPSTEMLSAGRKVLVKPRGGAPKELLLEHARLAGDSWLLGFEGVHTREAAEALSGSELSVARTELPPLEADEFYHCDAVGLRVVDEAGAQRGTVRQVLRYPSCDALLIELDGDGKAEREVPLVPGLVLEVDVPGGKVLVSTFALEDP